MFRIETDRHPGRKIFFGALDETIAGLEVQGRVRMKPRMLRIAPDHFIRVDAEEVLYLEADEQGLAQWHTLRGTFHDLDCPTLDQALLKATRTGVFVRISETCAVAPSRIMGIRLQRTGNHLLEVESAGGDLIELGLNPSRLTRLEECLEAINLGGGFLVSEPEDG